MLSFIVVDMKIRLQLAAFEAVQRCVTACPCLLSGFSLAHYASQKNAKHGLSRAHTDLALPGIGWPGMC